MDDISEQHSSTIDLLPIVIELTKIVGYIIVLFLMLSYFGNKSTTNPISKLMLKILLFTLFISVIHKLLNIITNIKFFYKHTQIRYFIKTLYTLIITSVLIVYSYFILNNYIEENSNFAKISPIIYITFICIIISFIIQLSHYTVKFINTIDKKQRLQFILDFIYDQNSGHSKIVNIFLKPDVFFMTLLFICIGVYVMSVLFSNNNISNANK